MARKITNRERADFVDAIREVSKTKPVFTYNDITDLLGWDHRNGLGRIMSVFREEGIIKMIERQQPHKRAKWAIDHIENGNKYRRYKRND